MTVGELREALEDYGDHLTVELYDEQLDYVYVDISIDVSTTLGGESRVTLSFSFDEREED